MANDRWTAPSASPLTTALTIAGPSDFNRYGLDPSWGGGDVPIGQSQRFVAHGTITTTGARTLALETFGFSGRAPYSQFGPSGLKTAVTAAGVTNQPWFVEYVETMASYNGTTSVVSWFLKTTWLFGVDTMESGIASTSTTAPFQQISFKLGWDSVANDATAGDSFTINGIIFETIA